MRYENVPLCLETAAFSLAASGEAGGRRAANYFLRGEELRSIPSVSLATGIECRLRTGDHTSDDPTALSGTASSPRGMDQRRMEGVLGLTPVKFGL